MVVTKVVVVVVVVAAAAAAAAVPVLMRMYLKCSVAPRTEYRAASRYLAA